MAEVIKRRLERLKAGDDKFSTGAGPDLTGRRQGPALRCHPDPGRSWAWATSLPDIPLRSLAKREEEVFEPGRPGAGTAGTQLPRATPPTTRPGRSPPLRQRLPPQAARQSHDGLRPRRVARNRPVPQESRYWITSVPPKPSRTPRWRNWKQCRGCPARSPAKSTPGCTGDFSLSIDQQKAKRAPSP